MKKWLSRHSGNIIAALLTSTITGLATIYAARIVATSPTLISNASANTNNTRQVPAVATAPAQPSRSKVKQAPPKVPQAPQEAKRGSASKPDGIGLPAQSPTRAWIIVAASLAAFFGTWQLIASFWAWSLRRRVLFVFLGEPATGKTALWLRFTDPAMVEKELRRLGRHAAVARITHKPVAVGRYEVVPVLTDIPGGLAGEQLTNILERRSWISRLFSVARLRVWVITLGPSHTDGLSTPRDIPRDDLMSQLGALKMYAAALKARKVPRPNLVVICLTKADAFMKNHPNDSTSKAARDELIGTFANHLSLLSSACAQAGVEHTVLLCSAFRGWGVDEILHVVSARLIYGDTQIISRVT